MNKEKCFRTHSQVGRWGSCRKDSLTFIKWRRWGNVRYAGETEMKKKRVFSRANNLTPLLSAGIIQKHCLINQQLNHIKRLMGSWNFRKVMGQSKQLDLSQTVWRWAKHSTRCWSRTHLGRRLCFQHSEETSPYSASQFCNYLQAVIEMPKDIGNTGHINTTVLNVATALNLQA